MTETDYILATNLARVRIAIEVAASLNPNTNHEKIALAGVPTNLRALESRWQMQAEKRRAGGK